MSKTRAPDPPEFHRQMAEPVRAGRSPEELAREFKPSAQAIRNWVSQADRDDDRAPAALRREPCHAEGRGGEEVADDDRIEGGDGEISRPPPPAREGPAPPWDGGLPRHDDNEYPGEGSKPDQGLII